MRELAAEVAGKNRKGHREACEKAMFAIDRRAELLQLVAGYRRLKRDLGLMDFSDQIELGARLAAEQPEVGAVERGKFRVVLLDEYQDTSVAQALMLSRLFSGPDAGARARATRSPRSATPTRRSTAGAAPRSATSSTSTRPSRPADGGPTAVPPHRQPALRPAHPATANRLAAALRRATTRSRRSRPAEMPARAS